MGRAQKCPITPPIRRLKTQARGEAHMRRRSTTRILLLLGLLVSIPNQARGQAGIPGCEVPNVVGVYTLTGNPSGLLVIDSQSGTAIQGRYGTNSNSLVNPIQGSFRCNVLTGTFNNTQYRTQGAFQYTFANDGASFTGSWRHHDGRYSGNWSGTRKGGITTDCSPQGYNCNEHTLPCCTPFKCTRSTCE